MSSDGACAYCGANGHQVDHLITSNQARRNIDAARERENPKYKVRCCSFCNQAKGTRLFVPESHAHLIPDLEALTHGMYRVYSLKALREVG